MSEEKSRIPESLQRAGDEAALDLAVDKAREKLEGQQIPATPINDELREKILESVEGKTAEEIDDEIEEKAEYKRGSAEVFRGALGEELRQMIVELLAERVAQRAFRNELKALIRKALDMRLPKGTEEELIEEAKLYLCAAANVNPEMARGSAVGLFESIIRSKKTSASVKIDAQKELSVMLGIDPRVRINFAEDPDKHAQDIRQFLQNADGVTRGTLDNKVVNTSFTKRAPKPETTE